jgi:hypothetical protein
MSSAANADHPARSSESGGRYEVRPKVRGRTSAQRARNQPRAKSCHLFMQRRLPVWGRRSGLPGDRLIRRMRVRAFKLGAGETLSGAIVVKSSLARLEARDGRVTCPRVVLRCVLVRRRITAAHVTAFDASAKMKPPPTRGRAFHTRRSSRLGCEVDAILLRLHRFNSLELMATTADAFAPRPYLACRQCFAGGVNVSAAACAVMRRFGIATVRGRRTAALRLKPRMKRSSPW